MDDGSRSPAPGRARPAPDDHLGHAALVSGAWPALVAAGRARVVLVASGPGPGSRLDWDDLHLTRAYDRWAAYGASTYANALLATELDRRRRHRGVRTFSVHPGYVRTPLQRHLTREEMVDAG